MENILALDLSTKSSGWATSASDKLEYGCITASSTDAKARIIKMRDAILDIIKKYKITKIVAEEVRPDLQNSHTQKILTWLQSAIVLSAYEYDKTIEIEFILPNSWRSKIGIKTGAGVKRETLKAKDIEYVQTKYGITVNDDIADAIGILDSVLNPVEKPKKDLSAFEGFDFK